MGDTIMDEMTKELFRSIVRASFYTGVLANTLYEKKSEQEKAITIRADFLEEECRKREEDVLENVKEIF